MNQEITLRVSEVRYRDVGKKIARLSDYAMKKLGIETENYIEIIGPAGSTPAQAKLTEHISDEEIGIDGNIRKFIGVDVDDKVKVRKANVRPATKIVLAPAEQSISFYSSFPEYVKYELLMNKPLTKGETIPIPTIGGSLDLVVVETQPSEYVYITDSTSIEIREESPKESELGGYSRITREDIGGIKSLGSNVSSPPIITAPSAPPTPKTVSSTPFSTPSSIHANSPSLSNSDIFAKIKSFQSRARDILEAVVAAVLMDLGFDTKVDFQAMSRDGKTREVDVWAQKAVSDVSFRVYVSCKNLDGDVGTPIIDQEFGRIDQLQDAPHMKFVVASSFNDQAKKAAIADGFIPIEIGFKVNESNAAEAYRTVYKIMNEVFTAIAPRRLQQLAEAISKVSGDLMRVSEELGRLASSSRSST